MREKLLKMIIISGLLVFGIVLSSCQGRVPIKITGQKQQDPRMIRVANRHESLGDQYYERVRIREAIQEWQIALELMPDDQLLVKKIQAAQTDKQLVMGSDGKLKAADEGQVPVKTDSKVSKDLNQAEHYYEQSQLKEARVAWQRILEMEADNAEAKSGLARLKDETYKKDSDRGLDDITESLYHEGMHAYRKRNWQTAKVKLSEAAKLNADQPQVKKYLEKVNEECRVIESSAEIQDVIKKAKSAQKLKQWQNARDLWKHVLKLKPEDKQAQAGLQICQKQLQVWADKRIDQAKEAVNQEKWKKALKLYRQVLKVLPKNKTAAAGAKLVHSKIEKYDDINPNRQKAEKHFNQGVTFYRAGASCQAVVEWKKAVELAPDVKEYQEWLNEGKKKCSEVNLENQRKAKVLYQDGLAAYQRGELEEALEALKEAVALDPKTQRYKKTLDKIKKELI